MNKTQLRAGRTLASLALAAAATGVAIQTAPAQAAQSTQPAQATQSAAADITYCPYTVSTAVNIRLKPSTSSTIMGVWYPGQTKLIQTPFVRSNGFVKISTDRWAYGSYLQRVSGNCAM